MTPLPDNPKIVIKLNDDLLVESVASNIASDIDIDILQPEDKFFDIASAGMPFNSKTPNK